MWLGMGSWWRKMNKDKKLLDRMAKYFGFKNKWVWCIKCEREILATGTYNYKTKMCRECEYEERLR